MVELPPSGLRLGFLRCYLSPMAPVNFYQELRIIRTFAAANNRYHCVMPELPEVEILVRHLRPLLQGKTVRQVHVHRAKVLRPTTANELQRALIGKTFSSLVRRGKYLRFELRPKNSRQPVLLLGHLGMTGRMFLASKTEPIPKHAAVVLDLGRHNFVFQDTRYFGRFTLDLTAMERLGPEPLGEEFTPAYFGRELKRSQQPIKVKLLDQALVAGVGNIYASEALFRAGIWPRRPANRLAVTQVNRLWATVREVLSEAIAGGSTVPLNFGVGKSDGLYYYGTVDGAENPVTERLLVYDRHGKPCLTCATPVKRIVQAARSTFFCPRCQKNAK
ncbi:MAG TPA: bifunctional DNA-formamidopyrimidine glycosylase/DNA-(apurinic or apyrimidinic site) lyase [Verrucomicrobiae bacterium]